jgi:hypothetical protein
MRRRDFMTVLARRGGVPDLGRRAAERDAGDRVSQRHLPGGLEPASPWESGEFRLNQKRSG